MRSFRPTPALIAGAVIVMLIMATALVCFIHTPFDPLQADPPVRLQVPG